MWKHGFYNPETGYWDATMNSNPWTFHSAGNDSARVHGSWDRSDPDVMDYMVEHGTANPYNTSYYHNPEWMHPELLKIRDPMELELVSGWKTTCNKSRFARPHA
eukprot:UN33029